MPGDIRAIRCARFSLVWMICGFVAASELAEVTLVDNSSSLKCSRAGARVELVAAWRPR